MKLLQAGVAKSGNYWLYTILQSILRRSGLPTHTYIETQPIYNVAREWTLSYPEQASIDTVDIEPGGVTYRISSIFRWPVHDLDAYLERATHVWTHSTVCKRSDTVFPKFDHIVYIIRDPRDVALSMARFIFTPYMQSFYPTQFASPEAYLAARLTKQVSAWREHVAGHLAAATRHKNIHIVFYERLLADMQGETAALCRSLGIEPTAALLDGVQADTSFESMQGSSPGHVSKGTARQWVTRLTDAQKTAVQAQAAPLLELLHYPRQPDGLDADLPRLPDTLDAARIAAAGKQPPPPLTLKSLLRRAGRKLLR